jgi:hypothetical protein
MGVLKRRDQENIRSKNAQTANDEKEEEDDCSGEVR